jgi:hypothetical protein
LDDLQECIGGKTQKQCCGRQHVLVLVVLGAIIGLERLLNAQLAQEQLRGIAETMPVNNTEATVRASDLADDFGPANRTVGGGFQRLDDVEPGGSFVRNDTLLEQVLKALEGKGL